MSANSYKDLVPHLGHNIVCVGYGADGQDPENVAVECETCHMVLMDFNREDDAVIPGDALARGIIERLEQHSTDSLLDDIVHDIASRIASGINNDGISEQVRYILDYFGPDAGLDAIIEAAGIGPVQED